MPSRAQSQALLSDVADAVTRGSGIVAGAGSVARERAGVIHHTTITLAALAIATADNTTAGANGSAKVYDLPEGNIVILGAVVNLTTVGAGGIAATAAVVGALGTVAAANTDATLTSTEANIVPSTAGTLVASAGVLKGISTAPVTLDGTATPVDVLLNVAVPDAGTSAAGTLTVSGTIELYWLNLGDK